VSDDPGSGASLWFYERAWFVAVDSPTPKALRVGSGSLAPTNETTAALCVDSDGLLLLIEPENAALTTSSPALTPLLARLACEHTLYLSESPRALLDPEERRDVAAKQAKGTPVDAAQGTAPDGATPSEATPSGATPSEAAPDGATPVRWFTREALTGAQRIFPATPIVPPNDWAFLQLKRVPYTGRLSDVRPSPAASLPAAPEVAPPAAVRVTPVPTATVRVSPTPARAVRVTPAPVQAVRVTPVPAAPATPVPPPSPPP
jgi:hypothetical protein